MTTPEIRELQRRIESLEQALARAPGRKASAESNHGLIRATIDLAAIDASADTEAIGAFLGLPTGSNTWLPCDPLRIPDYALIGILAQRGGNQGTIIVSGSHPRSVLQGAAYAMPWSTGRYTPGRWDDGTPGRPISTTITSLAQHYGQSLAQIAGDRISVQQPARSQVFTDRVLAPNDTGMPIGTAVRIGTSSGGTSLVARAIASGPASDQAVVGLVADASTSDVYHITSAGTIVVPDIDAILDGESGDIAPGQPLYLSTSAAGRLTNTRPSRQAMLIGYLSYAALDPGPYIIYLAIQPIGQLSLIDLHDVDYDPSELAEGDALKWDGENWTAEPAGDPLNLGDLADVNVTDANANDFLRFDGTNWIANNPGFAAIAFSGEYDDLTDAPPVITQQEDQWWVADEKPMTLTVSATFASGTPASPGAAQNGQGLGWRYAGGDRFVAWSWQDGTLRLRDGATATGADGTDPIKYTPSATDNSREIDIDVKVAFGGSLGSPMDTLLRGFDQKPFWGRPSFNFNGGTIHSPGAHTYTVPAGVRQILIIAIGGGGGAAGLSESTVWVGNSFNATNTTVRMDLYTGSGGNGASAVARMYRVFPGQTFAVNVGSGGAGSSSGNGGQGGDSFVTDNDIGVTVATARGGRGGLSSGAIPNPNAESSREQFAFNGHLGERVANAPLSQVLVAGGPPGIDVSAGGKLGWGGNASLNFGGDGFPGRIIIYAAL